jgi:major membrane immunogen (membrane-anchored lipoprotein)
MGGLRNICKIYGGMNVSCNGKTVEWVYDYIQDKPRLKSEMTKEEIADNERFKWGQIKKRIKPKQKPDAVNGNLF